jgi:hypothetical protein
VLRRGPGHAIGNAPFTAAVLKDVAAEIEAIERSGCFGLVQRFRRRSASSAETFRIVHGVGVASAADRIPGETWSDSIPAFDSSNRFVLFDAV